MGARREIAPTERTDVTEILHDEATLRRLVGKRGAPWRAAVRPLRS